MPLGRVIIGDSAPSFRWGEGKLGTVTWSPTSGLFRQDSRAPGSSWSYQAQGNGPWWDVKAPNTGSASINPVDRRTGTQKYVDTPRLVASGEFQFEKLTIQNGMHIEVDSSLGANIPQRLIIFCSKELVIEDNVYINAGRNNTQRRAFDWFEETQDWPDPINENWGPSGGGGGGGGANHTGSASGSDGKSTTLYFTTARGRTRYTSTWFIMPPLLGHGEGGAAGRGRKGTRGTDGFPNSTGDYNLLRGAIAENFGFGTTPRKSTGVDDYPVWQGGRGGNGGGGGNSPYAVGGSGGRGGGTIILVAPKITIGKNVVIDVQGMSRQQGVGNDFQSQTNSGAANRGLNGAGRGDGGSGGGGAGGGGFLGIVYSSTGSNNFTVGSNSYIGVGTGDTYHLYGPYYRNPDTALSTGGVGAYGGYGYGEGNRHNGGNSGGDGGNGGYGVKMVGSKPFVDGNIIWEDGIGEGVGKNKDYFDQM